PPPPTPLPTQRVIRELPTPLPYQTAPPPQDEDAVRTPVRIAATPEGTGTAMAYDAVVDVAEAAMRDGPGVRFDVTSTLRAGDRLGLVGRTADGSWLLVRVLSTGVEGWVLADLLQLELPAARAPIIETPTATPRPAP
ncbi:MAG: SH3 domain-containing protein, partial [Anaerolineae bacterium]